MCIFFGYYLVRYSLTLGGSIQGDLDGWMNLTDPLDDTLTFNQTGLELMMAQKGGSIWGGYLMPWDKFVYGVTVGQKYLMENTTLGIPALIQSEGELKFGCYLVLPHLILKVSMGLPTMGLFGHHLSEWLLLSILIYCNKPRQAYLMKQKG